MSVVDANLKVYGIENLRITDISVMPRNRSEAVAQIDA
jgi:choline dehydrogenase-like flavoprotein